MPLNRKWRSMDFFGSHESLSKVGQTSKDDHSGAEKGHHHHHLFSLKNAFRQRLSSIGSRDEQPTVAGKKDKEAEPPDPSGSGLVQRCVIIQKDEKGYGFTVSGDNPVFVASVKADGAAAKAGVQQGDRIVKVNGTLVTSRNHVDVVKLIKSGSYVALTLLGKPHPGGNPVTGQPTSTISSNRDSMSGRVTAPQPVDPDKDRELWQQKVHMTRAMYETAKEDFEKLQRQYVSKPSEKLHSGLLEKERTVKALENQLKQLTGSGDDPTSPSNLVPISNRYSDSEHGGLEHSAVQSWQPRVMSPSSIKHSKQSSVPSLIYRSMENSAVEVRSIPVTRSKSDAASRKSKTSSTFYVGFHGTNDTEAKKRYFHLKRWRSLTPVARDNRPVVHKRSGKKASSASSLPTTTSDLGSMSDSPQTSPSVSPTPNDPHSRHNGQDMEDSVMGPSSHDIITIDDEDIHSEDDQVNDPGPFADIKLLESKPAHMAILLNYLISNSDPSPVLFHMISEQYSRNAGSSKELRKWAYEIYSTFIAQSAPLSIGVEDNIICQIDNILTTSATKTDNENVLRSMFVSSRQSVQNEIGELLADFRNKKDLGMGNFYGFNRLQDNMDRAAEVKVAEELLIPHLEAFGPDDNNQSPSDKKDQAIGWALATFLRSWAGSKSAHSSTLDRVQTFMMKDKRSIKFPGSRSSRAKGVKGHQFTLQHFYVPTFCNFCGHLVWGVGYQGYQCQSCEMTLHKQCVEEITEVCGGKQKKRVSKLIPTIPGRRPSSNSQTGSQSYSTLDHLTAMGRPISEAKSPPHTDTTSNTTQPYKEEDTELAVTLSLIAGLPSGHSVKSLVNRYKEMTSPTGPGPGNLGVPGQPGTQQTGNVDGDRRGSADLNRSGSLNNKGEKGDRPPRRTKSDVDVDSDTFKAINQSGSSSASSLSNRSMESPSNSTDNVNDAWKAVHEDSDFEVETELPPLKQVLGEDVLRKLKPKEKKRQEVINELFYTERAHLRNLKVIDVLFNRPMLQERGVIFDLARALFPNMEEMIELHETMVKAIKERCRSNSVVQNVGDLLLKRFDGEAGEKFRKGCAEYCRNQAFALDALKKQTRKEPKLSLFLTEAEAHSMCRRLQLKDLVPSQMQRLTKYPLLIDSLLKYTQANSDEYRCLERAHEKCKHILAYVNQAVKECENYHKLKDIQKKLDRRSVETSTSTDKAFADLKNLDVTQHKLIFDGPLTWKLRSHRTVDLHVLLFEDLLVLLQKQDDKYVLKCQNTNTQTGKEDHKYTHSPILRLQNVLARNLATDKKSFFVVNMSESRAQMYEFSAATSDMRIKWCKLINDKSDELKKTSNSPNPLTRSSTMSEHPQHQPNEIERGKNSRISRKGRSGSSPTKSYQKEAVDQVDSLMNLEVNDELSSEGELIQPEEVNVSNAIMAEATPVCTPIDLLRSNGEAIQSALEEREKLMAEALQLSVDQYRVIAQQPVNPVRKEDEDEEEEDEDEEGRDGTQFLLARASAINSGIIRLINTTSMALAQQQASEEESPSPSSPSRPLSILSQGSTSEAESSNSGVSSSQPNPSPPHPQQSGGINLPVPMEQLKGMATEMNTILAKLMNTMNSGTEERQRLREELSEAQQRVDALKVIQRQMTASGAFPTGRLSPSTPKPSSAASDIPSLSASTTAASPPPQQADVSEPATASQPQQEGGEEGKETEKPKQKEEVGSSPSSETCASPREEVVHHGIQVDTVPHLEERVEALPLSDNPPDVVPVMATESRTVDSCGLEPGQAGGNEMIEVAMRDDEDEDDDDDNNEVSVADLPLPDISKLPEGDELAPSSSMMDVVEFEDSDGESDDNDTLTSKNSYQDFPVLATTIEDPMGEEREEGEDEKNFDKTSSSVLDTEIITSSGVGGGQSASSGGQDSCVDEPDGSSSVDSNKKDKDEEADSHSQLV